MLIDQRENTYLTKADVKQVRFLCDRRFGIGADGLILLQNHPDFDFEMVYFNADGNESSMCGNGGRCITAFAHSLGIFDKECSFLAIDGPHDARIHKDGRVELKMTDVKSVEKGADFYVLDTGSPHYVVFVEDLDDINVPESGSLIRYSEAYRKEGINVNFVEKTEDALLVGTYERGVEDETLSCGTGVTACALVDYLHHQSNGKNSTAIKAKGGDLSVSYQASDDGGFTDIWLSGPAQAVFKGEVVF